MLLNNGMRLGSTSPYPDNVNYVGAGKVLILNNSPVVVLKDDKTCELCVLCVDRRECQFFNALTEKYC